MRVSRRVLLLEALPLTALVACASGGGDPTTDFESSAVEFAEPWADMATQEITAFGVEVLRERPDAVEHARRQLDESQDLDTACDEDAADGSFVEVAGWTVPTTLAGLAGALAVLAAG